MEYNIKLNFENYLNEKNFSSSQKEIKEDNFDNFIKNGFPNKRIEDWKFSDLKQIITTNFDNIDFSKKEKQSNIDENLTVDLEHNKIVFIDGIISKIDFSYENEEKVVVEQNSNLEKELSENSLLNLNTAFVSDYTKILVKSGYQFKKPLILFNFLSNDLNNIGLNTRLDIDLEDDVSLNVINISNENPNKNFLNFRQKINIGKNSIFKNYSLDINENSNFKYTFKDINLEKNSHLEYFILSKGSKFLKHDINCSLNSEYGSVVLNGIIDLNKKKHHEIKTFIKHLGENTKSYQLVKSVLGKASKAAYQGKISVNSIAQKTDGYQLSRALLLNDEVEFNAKPELEIYADDVKCSHGSTSGNVDEDSIFYLMSRGLSYEQSKKLLTNGFLNEVIEKITNDEVKLLVKKLMGINE